MVPMLMPTLLRGSTCVCPGDFLQPDEISFAVLLRGYGMKSPPDWVGIDRVLSMMRSKFGLEPTASGWRYTHGDSAGMSAPAGSSGMVQRVLVHCDTWRQAVSCLPHSPCAASYNVLLEVCNRTNDLDRGEEVIDRMSEDGVEVRSHLPCFWVLLAGTQLVCVD
jgi:pentatricopeptide repeat protein